MNTPFSGKRILLGVTGSIACYKAVELASNLTQEGALVDVILTQSALQFITPLTYQSVTGRRVYTDSDLWGGEGHIQHIGLGNGADLLVIAPVTANTIARLAHGIADNLLTLSALAASCPIIIAPAMDSGMFNHPATQANIEILDKREVKIIGPVEGRMASGISGLGRMVEPADLLGHIRQVLARDGALRGRHIIVTAGGTSEPIDPVRAITNKSSGKQGFAIAQAALDLGADVTLISGVTHLPAPIGVRRVDAPTARDMLQAVLNAVPRADALIMAAAVADFVPETLHPEKIKRTSGISQIKLELSPDILEAVAQQKDLSGSPRIIVGFAAESQDLLTNARAKLTSKKMDLLVANDISAKDAGFAVDTNRVTLLDAHGNAEELPLMSKQEVAAVVINRLVKLITS